MAYMEGKLQPIDLLSAWQLGQRGRQAQPVRNRMEDLMKEEQLKAMQMANLQAKLKMGPAIMVTPGPVNAPNSSRGQFLTDTPGYITGVSPEQVYQGQNDITKSLIGLAASSDRYGRGGMQEQPGEPTNTPKSDQEKALIYNMGRGAGWGEKQTSTGDNPDSRREAFARELQTLQDKQLSADKSVAEVEKQRMSEYLREKEKGKKYEEWKKLQASLDPTQKMLAGIMNPGGVSNAFDQRNIESITKKYQPSIENAYAKKSVVQQRIDTLQGLLSDMNTSGIPVAEQENTDKLIKTENTPTSKGGYYNLSRDEALVYDAMIKRGIPQEQALREILAQR